jgi:APA family basic amino acid/polyamine antiporter
MIGTLNGAMLTDSRLPYAMAAAGQLPRALAAVHPRHRTPHVAVLFSGVLVFALTVSSLRTAVRASAFSGGSPMEILAHRS